uniref:Cytochrome P450 n=1 Tax=Glossina brevipalpis TaxID=37001 RepID=A0A1A9WGR5_9MUSC
MFGFLIFGVTIFVLLYLLSNYTYWKRRGVLHETPLPLLGNFKGVGRKQAIYDVTERIYKKFKNVAPFAGVYMFLTPALLIFDLNLVKYILIKDFNNFHDRSVFNNVKDDPLTGHLFALEGDQWKAMRTKLSPVFTSARMKFMFPTILKVGQQFTEALTDIFKSSSDQVLEIKDLCARFSTDVIGNCVFGVECNSCKDPQSEFRVMGRSIFNEPRHHPIIQAFMATNPKLAQNLRMKFIPDKISAFILNLMRQSIDYRMKNKIKRNDFVQLLMELRNETEYEEQNEKLEKIDLSLGLTLEQMAAQAFVFFIAGFETSSATMSFCLYELAKHLDIQTKLRLQIENVIEQHNNELTYEALNSMPYMDQVIAETLRLYPFVPNLIRKCCQSYQVPNTTLVIEKGATILLPVRAIHHDAEFYEEPEKFKPERFEASEIENRHPCAYLPFGDGPRNCIGMRFGKMQTKIGLIAFLRKYSVDLCDKTEIPLELDHKKFTVSPKNGIYLKINEV